jgi:hypothetical protein
LGGDGRKPTAFLDSSIKKLIIERLLGKKPRSSWEMAAQKSLYLPYQRQEYNQDAIYNQQLAEYFKRRANSEWCPGRDSNPRPAV